MSDGGRRPEAAADAGGRDASMPGAEAAPPAPKLWTVGHSTLTLAEFAARLRAADVRGLADVRRFPASRRHPQFERRAFEDGLRDAGIAYRWFEALGGRRSPARGAAGQNAGLRVSGFRAYADYALTPAFREALDELVAWARETSVAICCAEGLWWQCHRRIVADHLVARGHRVVHLLPRGGSAEHALWDLARLTPEGPTYPAPQTDVFSDARGEAE